MTGCPHKALHLPVITVYEVKLYEYVICICFLQKTNLQLFCENVMFIMWMVRTPQKADEVGERQMKLGELSYQYVIFK